jgi:hypothetical protein
MEHEAARSRVKNACFDAKEWYRKQMDEMLAEKRVRSDDELSSKHKLLKEDSFSSLSQAGHILSERDIANLNEVCFHGSLKSQCCSCY